MNASNDNPKSNSSPGDLLTEKQNNHQGASGSGSPEESKTQHHGVPNANKIFVGNLSFRTSWQNLKDHMKTVGKVGRVNIFEDRNGRSKGCGVVEFDSKEDADKAIKELNESTLDGR